LQQASTWFAQLTLTPSVRKIEAEFPRVLFSDPDVHLEVDMSGLMRGDYTARWQAAQIAIQNGALTPNEIRESGGYNPRPDGDVLRTMPGARCRVLRCQKARSHQPVRPRTAKRRGWCSECHAAARSFWRPFWRG
jgi:hypothetical protein